MGAWVICLATVGSFDEGDENLISTHVLVYGGTSAGISAALQASRMGLTVIVIEPSKHIGGLTTSGLGYTDTGDKSAIGGIAREFYQLVKKHYDQPSAWKFEQPSDCKDYRPSENTMWVFEPSVAEKILREMIANKWQNSAPRFSIVYGERLDRNKRDCVHKAYDRIQFITTTSGRRYSGRIFIDATYEGDLMAEAGVSYTVGREANAQYGETLNGVQTAKNVHNHRFIKQVSPYVVPGNAASGMLPGIEPDWLPPDGSADKRVQAFCYRMCLTQDPRNRKPFAKPEGYDEREYELLLRNFEAGDLRLPWKPDMMPNRKTDVNNNGAVSTDFIGRNWDYAEASDERRKEILAEHLRYQQGLMWTLQSHPRVPESVRAKYREWGLAADEFEDSGGWPHGIYVREARRMIGAYLTTELDCLRKRQPPTPIGMGSYNMDSHNVTRYVARDGFVQNEGDIQVSPGGPYQISYDSITPKESECRNLLVPVCLSSSHIAYGSIRMEPVFMVLGQSAGTAAALALQNDVSVQRIDREKLTARLLADGQVLSRPSTARASGIDPKRFEGIVIDDSQAERIGFDCVSDSIGPYVGDNYRHDGGEVDKFQCATFRRKLTGRYEVRIAYTANPNRRDNATIGVHSAAGRNYSQLDLKKKPSIPPFHSLGVFDFNGQAAVEVRNDRRTDKDEGHTIVDAVQFLPVKQQ